MMTFSQRQWLQDHPVDDEVNVLEAPEPGPSRRQRPVVQAPPTTKLTAGPSRRSLAGAQPLRSTELTAGPSRRRLPALQPPPATELKAFGRGHTLRGNRELTNYAAVFLRWWYTLIPEADVVETVDTFALMVNAAYNPARSA